MRTLVEWREALNKIVLHKMEPVVIPSRDGLSLNGYLTRPHAEAGSGRLPLVLVIHGGPYAPHVLLRPRD